MKTVAKFVVAFLLFSIISSFVYATGEEQIKIAVLEFENNSGKPDLEHLKKGIRDMITTDITQVNDITVVERARIDQVFKEINLSKSEYFDKDNSVKIGKLIGASYLLTGAYLLDNNTMRIDVRFVNVNSGMVVYAEKVQGQRDDFFDLEKVLVSAIIKKMKPNITSRELRRVNQLQTESYETFDTYSQAVYLEEQGNLTEAIKIMQKASKEDPSFKMAQEKLSSFQKAVMERIAEQTEINAKAEKGLKEIMDSDFSTCKTIVEIQDHSPLYYLSVLSLAVHYGLRSDFQNERDYLLKFWDEFSKEPAAAKIWSSLQKEMEKKSLQWEKSLMKIDHAEKGDSMSFSDEAEKIFVYPRFANIWPFCENVDILPELPLDERRHRVIYYFLPHDLFTIHKKNEEWNGVIMELRDYAQNNPSARGGFDKVFSSTPVQLKEITDLNRLKIETSIAAFYINHTDLKIPKKNFESILKTIIQLLDGCSPYDSKNAYAKEDVLLLLERLSVVSPHISDKNQKLKVDKFILLLTKFLKGDGSGDVTSKGITISKTYFEGDNIAIISFLPSIPPINDINYEECMINGIQAFNPNGKFYLATPCKKFNNDFTQATKDNVVKSIEFLKKNIYCFSLDETLSIDRRLVEAYMAAPDKEETHIILFLENSTQLASSSGIQIPYYFKRHPKKVKLSIVLTDGDFDLDKVKEHFKNEKMDYDSLLNLAIFSGGDIFVKDIKKSFSSKSRATKWFNDKVKTRFK